MITNSFLNEIANAITSNTFVVPSYLGTGTTVVSSILATDTSLYGEIGTRQLLTKAVNGNVASYSATRSTANVITTTTGDYIQTMGLLTTSTSGTLHEGIVIGGITQTTNFNIEIDVDILIDRA